MITTSREDPVPSKALPTRAADAPERELRLLVEGIREWLSRLGREGDPPGSIGLLEGQGHAEVLWALGRICRELGMHVLHGKCSAFSGWPPGAMGSVAEQVLLEGENDGGASEKAAPAIFDEVSWLVPGSRGTPPPSLGPELDGSRSVDALARAILQLGARKPALLMLEDVPRADSFTMDVLRHVLRILCSRRERQRVLVIVSAGVPGRLDATLAGGGVHWKHLEAFRVQGRGYSREDIQRVSLQILGEELPVSLREKVFRATGGGVRHVLWLLWSFKESGATAWKVEDFSAAGAAFQEIVQARYSRLAPAEKEMVRTLAALDAPCPHGLLSELAPSWGPGMVSVEDLRARGWVLGPCPWIDGEVAEVVLGKAGESSRRKLHGTLGSRLAQVGLRDWRWLACAFHHSSLSKSALAALDPLRECLSRMQRLGSLPEALRVLEDFLGSAPPLHPHEDRELLVQKADLLAALGQDSRAMEVYRGLLAGEKDPDLEALLRRRMGGLHGKQLAAEEQVEEYVRGLQALGESPSPERPGLLADLSRAYLEIAQVEQSREGFLACLESLEGTPPCEIPLDEGIHHLLEEILRRGARKGNLVAPPERFLELCGKAGGVRGHVSRLLAAACLEGLRGDPASAEGRLSDALRHAHESGSRWLSARVLEAWGCLAGEWGAPEKALRCLEESRQILAECGKEAEARRVTREMVGLELGLMRPEPAARDLLSLAETWPRSEASPVKAGLLRPWGLEARARAQQVEELETSSKGTGAHNVERRFLLAQLLEAEGRLSDALKLYHESLQADAGHGPATVQSRAVLAMGRIAALRGDDAGALRLLEQSLALQGDEPQRDVILEAHLEVSGILLSQGEYRRAFDHGARGLRQAFEIDDREGVTFALLRLAALLDEVGWKVPAVDLARAARVLASEGDLALWELAACEQLARLCWWTSAERPGLDGMDRALVLCEQLELPIEQCRLKLEQAWRDHRAMRFADGLLRAREGIEIARSLNIPPLLDELLHVLGVMESSAANPRKNFLRALDFLEQARQGAAARKHPRLHWEVLHAMANIYRERGKLDLSEELSLGATEIELQVFTSCPKELQGAGWSLRHCGAGPKITVS